MSSHYKGLLLLTAGLALMATQAAAEGMDSPTTAPAVSPPAAEAAPAKSERKAVTDADLAQLAGGTDTVVALTDQDLTAVNSGNNINANTVGSGAISLQDGALSSFGGLGNFIMNTGHNNNLQSTLSVTIVVTQ